MGGGRARRSPRARAAQTLERDVEKLAALPFVDVLYIRCDWRDVQSRPGRLDLHPVWALTLDAAQRHGLPRRLPRAAVEPRDPAAAARAARFRARAVPLVTIGSRSGRGPERVEPRYDHPAFQAAFRELNELLAAEFDGDPLVEFMDLMMYGFWGEGHTGDYPSPFPDYLTAERTMVEMTRAADRGMEARAAGGQHAAGHQPRRQPRGAGPRRARGLLAALGQHHRRGADADREAREPAAVAAP